MAKTNGVNVKSLALSLGVTWGLFLAFLGALATAGWGAPLVEVLGSYYIGFGVGAAGIAAGFIWGVVCAGIGGAVLGWLYNYFSRKM